MMSSTAYQVFILGPKDVGKTSLFLLLLKRIIDTHDDDALKRMKVCLSSTYRTTYKVDILEIYLDPFVKLVFCAPGGDVANTIATERIMIVPKLPNPYLHSILLMLDPDFFALKGTRQSMFRHLDTSIKEILSEFWHRFSTDTKKYYFRLLKERFDFLFVFNKVDLLGFNEQEAFNKLNAWLDELKKTHAIVNESTNIGMYATCTLLGAYMKNLYYGLRKYFDWNTRYLYELKNDILSAWNAAVEFLKKNAITASRELSMSPEEYISKVYEYSESAIASVVRLLKTYTVSKIVRFAETLSKKTR